MSFTSDVVLSVRRLRKDVGFTGIAVAILALGIGVNTAIFSLVNTILLRPLTAVPADRIVGLYQKDETQPDSYRAFSYPDYKDIREGNEIFESVMAHNFSMVGLTEGDVIEVSTPGGGGYGMPSARSRVEIERDIGRGYYTREQAARLFGVHL